MRVTVGMIVRQIFAGHSVEEALTGYPYLEREDVLQALRYAAWLAQTGPRRKTASSVKFTRYAGALLHAELDGHGQMHGDGFTVQAGWLIFPLVQRVHGGLVQQRGSADHFHRGDFAGGVNQRVDFDVAADVLGPGKCRIDRRNGLE